MEQQKIDSKSTMNVDGLIAAIGKINLDNYEVFVTPQTSDLLANGIVLYDVFATLGINSKLVPKRVFELDVKTQEKELSLIISEFLECTDKDAEKVLSICLHSNCFQATTTDGKKILLDSEDLSLSVEIGDTVLVSDVHELKRKKIKAMLGIEIKDPTTGLEGPTK